MKLADRQAKLDAHKWEMSQKAGHDTCDNLQKHNRQDTYYKDVWVYNNE